MSRGTVSLGIDTKKSGFTSEKDPLTTGIDPAAVASSADSVVVVVDVLIAVSLSVLVPL